MNTPSEEPTIHERVTKGAELEQEDSCLHEELTQGRALLPLADGREEPARPQTRSRPQRSSRRKMLTKGLGVAAVASVGAGALLELSGGTAQASGAKPGIFASSTAGTPAVSATGTNGADGVDVSSDSGIGVSARSSSNTGVSATSGSGTGLVATSSSGLAGHFVGNVNIDNNLTVAGASSTGTLSSGAGALASSVSGTPAVKAGGTNGATGLDAASDSGMGVSASSTSGTGLLAKSSSGLAGHFMGNVQMDNDLTVSGTVHSNGVRSQSNSGTGVQGFSNSGTGVSGVGNYGVIGISSFADGVRGESSSTTDSAAGVHGVNTSSGLAGLFEGNVSVTGFVNSDNGVFTGGNGVISVVGPGGNGVGGVASNGTGVTGISDSGTGVHGQSNTGLAGLFEGNVQVNGNFSVTGLKNFVQAHPTDPSQEIVYVALEGGEAGTYVRGTGQLQSGKAVLALPEHFGLVTATEGLTVHLTPRGEWLQLYVVELDTAQLVVREAQGKSGAFDYLIHGVRRGYEQYEVLRTKR